MCQVPRYRGGSGYWGVLRPARDDGLKTVANLTKPSSAGLNCTLSQPVEWVALSPGEGFCWISPGLLSPGGRSRVGTFAHSWRLCSAPGFAHN